MSKISVLIVEDSSLVANHLSRIVDSNPDMQVIGTAEDGEIALQMLADGYVPDVMLLDVVLPKLSGLKVLEFTVKMYPTVRVIVVSRHTSQSSQTTVQALVAGASDYYLKPMAASREEMEERVFEQGLIRKIRSMTDTGDDFVHDEEIVEPKKHYRSRGTINPQCVVVGASTGGPEALSLLFSNLDPRVQIPFLVVQHIPGEFSKWFAKQLSSASRRNCLVAAQGMEIQENALYLAPGDKHMIVVKKKGKYFISLNKDAPMNSCRPAIDHLFLSAAQAYQDNLLGVVLTGMGEDGRRGSAEIVRFGGQVVVQDKTSSIVWAMPGCVAADGNASQILPVGGISNYINCLLRFG